MLIDLANRAVNAINAGGGLTEMVDTSCAHMGTLYRSRRMGGLTESSKIKYAFNTFTGR